MTAWKLAAIILSIVLALVVTVIACGDDDYDDDDDDDTAADDDSADDDSTDDDDDDDDTTTTTISVSGNAFSFPDYQRIVGAKISVLEFPERETLTIEEGYFVFEDLPVGAEATFVLEHKEYRTTQTKTFTLPVQDVEKVTFQVPNHLVFFGLALLIGLEVDDTKCQIVTTVTVPGKSIYDQGAHGEAGAQVSIDPPLPADHGPIYFNDDVKPDPSLTESSSDGGVLYTNVPPGEYVLQAQKQDVDFIFPKMKCRANVLVNASPPYGLQAVY